MLADVVDKEGVHSRQKDEHEQRCGHQRAPRVFRTQATGPWWG